MTVYADDGSYASPTPGEALEVANCWDNVDWKNWFG